MGGDEFEGCHLLAGGDNGVADFLLGVEDGEVEGEQGVAMLVGCVLIEESAALGEGGVFPGVAFA